MPILCPDSTSNHSTNSKATKTCSPNWYLESMVASAVAHRINEKFTIHPLWWLPLNFNRQFKIPNQKWHFAETKLSFNRTNRQPRESHLLKNTHLGQPFSRCSTQKFLAQKQPTFYLLNRLAPDSSDSEPSDTFIDQSNGTYLILNKDTPKPLKTWTPQKRNCCHNTFDRVKIRGHLISMSIADSHLCTYPFTIS